ncbi:conserved hypothetical protein [Beggiatoa sp. PS]|nr:conserved hypothetical protein [Beggiatoa sp. PS]
MENIAFTEQLAFLVTQRQINETTLLAQAVSKGIQILYQEAIIEAYLLDQVSREHALKILGPTMLKDIEYQRDALKQDVEWGLKGN